MEGAEEKGEDGGSFHGERWDEAVFVCGYMGNCCRKNFWNVNILRIKSLVLKQTEGR